MKQRKRALATLAAASTLFIGLTACTGSGHNAAEGPSNHTVRISMTELPETIVPLSVAGFQIHQMARFAYDTLVDTNSDGEIVKHLADEWTFDGTTATFHIQDGITCSDGEPFTAETVVNNFKWHQDEANESAKVGPGLGGTTDYTVSSDGSTVTVELAEPNSSFLHHMHFLPMVCDSGLKDEKSLSDKTAGTGAWVLESAEPGVKYTYTRRDGYTWGPNSMTTADPGVPAKVEVIGAADGATAIGQFIAGEVDITMVEGKEDKARVADIPGLTMSAGSNAYPFLWFNQKDGSPTQDVKVRLALVSAVDWEAVRSIYTGNDPDAGTANGLAQQSPMMCPENPSATGSVPAFDAAKASSLLDEAGFTAGADGTRTTPDGDPFAITFLIEANDPAIPAATEYIADQWKAIGVGTKIESGDYWANFERMAKQNDWQAGYESAGYGIPSQWLTEFTDTPDNVAGIANQEYADTAKQALAAPDAAQACELWAEAEASLWRNADVAPIGMGTEYWAGRDGISIDAVMSPESIRVR